MGLQMTADNTKALLEQLLTQLYEEQSITPPLNKTSFLESENGQFLGEITTNKVKQESILNQYGPYGSSYSTTSIFNKYSDYGSSYGSNSIHNPYCATPPKFISKGKLVGRVTNNKSIIDRVSTDAFLYTLKNDTGNLVNGVLIKSEIDSRILRNESFIQSGDGQFLGKLTPNVYDNESIFSKFGKYGNKFSQESIFNRFSKYGNEFNTLSPYNQFSNNPPKIYLNGKFVAHLTKNTQLTPSVHPEEIFDWAQKNVSKNDGNGFY
jgi:hypothetical protein